MTLVFVGVVLLIEFSSPYAPYPFAPRSATGELAPPRPLRTPIPSLAKLSHATVGPSLCVATVVRTGVYEGVSEARSFSLSSLMNSFFVSTLVSSSLLADISTPYFMLMSFSFSRKASFSCYNSALFRLCHSVSWRASSSCRSMPAILLFTTVRYSIIFYLLRTSSSISAEVLFRGSTPPALLSFCFPFAVGLSVAIALSCAV